MAALAPFCKKEQPSRVAQPPTEAYQRSASGKAPPRKRAAASARRKVLVALSILTLLAVGAWWLGGMIFKTKVKTADGEAYVVLEIDQPGAEVQVDEQKITVNVPGDDKPVEIKIEPGQHRLRISKDGFVAVTREIEFKTGKSPPIKVRLELVQSARRKDDQPPAAPSGDAEKELALLLAKAKAPDVNADKLRDEIIEFCLKYRGTQQAYQAGALLPKMPPLTNSIGMKFAPIPPGKFRWG